MSVGAARSVDIGMQIKIPKLSLVVLIGASGSGKSTFARRHFLKSEVLTSDECRAFVSDDENNQSATNDAFDVLHFIAAKRLARGNLTVVDATNVQPESRQPLVELARKFHCLPVAIVLNLPEAVCRQRNEGRDDRQFGPHVITQQRSQLRRSLRGLRREGFRHIFVLESVDEVEAAAVERVPLWNDRAGEHGPFDIIGDVHGCCDELEELLAQLGYEPGPAVEPDPLWGDVVYQHPDKRRAVFVGDLVDRGPRILDVVRIVRNMVTAGTALCVPGNHDMKLMRKLNGRDVQITHGLANSLAEIDALPADGKDRFRKALAEFLDSLVSHYVFDDRKLVVAHAGMKEEMQGRGSGRVRDFALYGETTGETDEFGLPVRHNWAAEYRGSAMVVYGHTPVPEPEWLNRTVNIDTGCVFGGKLDCAALSGTRIRPGSRPAHVLRTSPPVPPRRAAGSAPHGSTAPRRRARRGGRDGEADCVHAAESERHHPGGKRDGRFGGDEPLCGQSEMASLPAADHVAV